MTGWWVSASYRVDKRWGWREQSLDATPSSCLCLCAPWGEHPCSITLSPSYTPPLHRPQQWANDQRPKPLNSWVKRSLPSSKLFTSGDYQSNKLPRPPNPHHFPRQEQLWTLISWTLPKLVIICILPSTMALTERALLHTPGQTWICDSPASACQVLGFQVCASILCITVLNGVKLLRRHYYLPINGHQRTFWWVLEYFTPHFFPSF